MSKMNGYVFTRRFLLALAASIVWIGLPAGIYFLVRGVDVWAAVLVLCALAALAMALNGRILRKLENRRITKGNAMFMILGWVNLALIIIVYLYSSISIYNGSVILIGLYALITVFLLALCAWTLLHSRYVQ
jgi:hypothetical protein